ncbi:MAG: glycosyltransferase family 2 protein [Proteobacteria bacterium]|nr:glycosyltransferase family 2 protein [Pseudomonadota bacterium]
MQIIIPMSGLGSRFQAAGYTEPKPLIKVDGKPIIEHVVRMFPGETDFVFVCAEDHLVSTEMKSVLLGLVPTAKIVPIKRHKLGPVYAVMQAAAFIKPDEPVTVSYCDYFASWHYQDFKQKMASLQCDGAIPCYRGFHPHLLLPNLYAGVRTDEQGYLIEIREKFSFTPNKMDTWQSSGAYYFRTGKILMKYFQALMDREISCKDEYYVSLVYNLLHEDGLKTVVYPQDFFCQWGTPQDLEIYQNWSRYFADSMVGGEA